MNHLRAVNGGRVHPIPKSFLTQTPIPILERIRFREEVRHTEAVLHGKRFISVVAVFAVAFLLIGSTFVAAAFFLFGQNIPANSMAAKLRGCTETIGAIDTLVVDTTRGGTGVTFVCPPDSFGPTHYAIQPTAAGTWSWNHSAAIGGYKALYLILSYAIPTEGCHKGIANFLGNPPIDSSWFLNMTTATGTLTVFDGDHAYAYCAEYDHLGNYGGIYVTWSQ